MLKLYRESFSGLSRSIWMLALVLFINRSGTMVIPFMTVYLTTDLGFTFSQAGVIMMFFGGGAVLGSFGGGWLTDKIGFYKVQFWSLFLSGLMFILLAFMETFWGLCTTIFILSMIAESFRPANSTAVAAYSKPENLTRSFSLLRIAVNVGYSIGPALGGLLASSIGYKYLFWADGFTCMFAGVMMLVFLPFKRIAPSLKKETVETEVVRKAHTDIPYLIFIGMVFLTAAAFLQLFTAVPVFFKTELHLTELQIGGLITMNGLIIGITEMPLVHSIEGRFKRLHLVIIGTTLFGVAFLTFTLPIGGLLLGVIGIFILSIGEMLNMPFANTIAMDRATDATRGQYMAFYTSAYSIAHIFSPFLGMRIAEQFGFDILWVVLFSLCFFAILGFWSLDRYMYRQSALA